MVAKKDMLRVIEQFFSDKNKSWVRGDSAMLVKWATTEQSVQPFIEDLQAWVRALQARDWSHRKSRTQLSVMSVHLEPGEESGYVDVVEDLVWIYSHKEHWNDLQRRQWSRVYMQQVNGEWKVSDVQRWGEKNEGYLDGDVVPDPVLILDDRDIGEVRGTYNRLKAFQYAELWWDRFNPAYKRFEVDCTSFVSQALFAGGFPMTHIGQKSAGWWYKHAGGKHDSWSYSWSVAHSLRWYLEKSSMATTVQNPGDLRVGDVICYDWDGDGRWEHNTIVTNFDDDGMPLVNAHTVASRHRYWDYQDSYAWTENTKYRFFHIHDSL